MNTKIICDNCASVDFEIVYNVHKKEDEFGSSSHYTISSSKTILKKPDKIAKCQNCGLMFIPTIPGHNKIFKDYEDYVDKDYIREEKGRRMASRIPLNMINTFVKNGKMLDIGCATGFFLDEARKMGWEVFGIEPSRWARKYAEEKLGLKILSATLNESDFEKESFDAVMMFDVIDHLNSPRKILLVINKILKKDGILVITTPNVKSILSRILGTKWWNINRHHNFYFSKNTLQDVLKRAGFRIVRCKSHERIFTWGYWLTRLSSHSLLWKLLLKPFLWIRRLNKQNIKLNLYDQIEVYARKL